MTDYVVLHGTADVVIHRGTHRGCARVVGRRGGRIVPADIAEQMLRCAHLERAAAQRLAADRQAALRARYLAGDRSVAPAPAPPTHDPRRTDPVYAETAVDRAQADQDEIDATLRWCGGYVQYRGELGRALLAVARHQLQHCTGWSVLGGETDRLIYPPHALFGPAASAAARGAQIVALAVREYAIAASRDHREAMRVWADLLAAASVGVGDIEWVAPVAA